MVVMVTVSDVWMVVMVTVSGYLSRLLPYRDTWSSLVKPVLYILYTCTVLHRDTWSSLVEGAGQGLLWQDSARGAGDACHPVSDPGIRGELGRGRGKGLVLVVLHRGVT